MSSTHPSLPAPAGVPTPAPGRSLPASAEAGTFSFWFAQADRLLVLLVQGWRPAFYDDARYAGWRVPLERPL